MHQKHIHRGTIPLGTHYFVQCVQFIVYCHRKKQHHNLNSFHDFYADFDEVLAFFQVPSVHGPFMFYFTPYFNDFNFVALFDDKCTLSSIPFLWASTSVHASKNMHRP